MQREPSQVLFRIPALGAQPAIFSKGSDRVVFALPTGPRVEVWSISNRTRENLWQAQENLHCARLVPSPDARAVACLGSDIKLIDMNAGAEIARHLFPPHAVSPFGRSAGFTIGTTALPTPPHSAAFTADASTFLVTPGADIDPWVYSIEKRGELKIGGPLKGALHGNFTFLAADRILLPSSGADSGLYTWPEGKIVENFSLTNSPAITPVTKGSEVILRPYQGFGAATMDLAAKKILAVNRTAALDRYNGVAALERASGELALFADATGKLSASVQLPDAEIGSVRAAAHSADLEWLAVSNSERSVLWNLKTGDHTAFLPFRTASISPDGIWSATFERKERSADGAWLDTLQTRAQVQARTHTQIANRALETGQVRARQGVRRPIPNHDHSPGRSARTADRGSTQCGGGERKCCEGWRRN